MLSKQMTGLQAQLAQQVKKTAQAEKDKMSAMTLAGQEQGIRRAAEKAAKAAERAARTAERRAEAAVAKTDTVRKAADAQRQAAIRARPACFSFGGRHPSIATPGAGGVAKPRGEEDGP